MQGHGEEQTPVTARMLLARGTAGTFAAAAANALVAWTAARVLSIPAAFEPLEVPRVVFLTVLGCAMATAAFALVQRMADRPERTFAWVALAALVLSFVPDVLLLVEPMTGTTTRGVAVLMGMHVVAAGLIVPALIGGWPPEDA